VDPELKRWNMRFIGAITALYVVATEVTKSVFYRRVA
jgi:hypothetical protein